MTDRVLNAVLTVSMIVFIVSILVYAAASIIYAVTGADLPVRLIAGCFGIAWIAGVSMSASFAALKMRGNPPLK